jgi:ABC-type transport system involved in cytochrome c biogenesis ATPase subunit
MIATKQATVNPLPPLPAGLEYRRRSYSGQHYITTGGFPVDATDGTIEHLASVGVLLLDFDLVDYVSHTAGMREKWTADECKVRMYQAYCGEKNAGTLRDIKAQHRAVVLDAVAAMVESMPGAARPTYVVDSGWGVHCYFWLKDTVTTRAEIDAARALNKRMVTLINGASGYELADKGVHDTGTRILRIVGSMNTQSQVKAQIGEPVETVILPDLSAPDARWDLVATLAAATDDAPKDGAWSGPAARPFVEQVATGNGETAAFRMLKGYAMGRLPKGVWNGAETEKKSETDAALAFALCLLRFPLSSVAQLCRSARGESQHDGTDYYERTAFKAWKFARGPITDVSADTNFDMMHDDVVIRLESSFTSILTLSTIAQHDPRVRAMIWVDERTRKIEWNTDHNYAAARAFCAHEGQDLPAERNGRRDFGDDQAINLCNWIGRTYGIPCGEKWRESMCIILASLEKRNPVRDELEACGKLARETGGPDLLSTWLLHAFPGLQDSPLLRVYSRKWLVGGAARAIDPGVFIKGMLVIVGQQSAGKSSMLRILGGRWYASPKVKELANKDSLMSYHYSWLLEMEEMDFMRGNSIEAIKSFLETGI